MSLFAQMPMTTLSADFYADAHTEFDELERPTLSFRQLRVALPHFLFEELFESGKKSKKAQQPAVVTPTVSATPAPVFQPQAPARSKPMPHVQHQQQKLFAHQPQPYATSPGPVARHPMRATRQRSDSESSSSSVDSMKLAGAYAASATASKATRRSPSPSSPTTLRNAESASEQLLMRSIRELPVELRDCFVDWRRERKEAILAHDLEKQRAVEKVMWNALHNIKASNLMQ